MDVEFLNSYTEVVLENFDAVLKQNLMFQTQLKVVEKRKGEKDELLKQLEEKGKYVQQLENTIAEMQNDLSASQELRKRVIDNDSVINEKSRIQQALNDTMQKVAELEKKITEKESVISGAKKEIDELKAYISKLEEITPTTKLKKLTGKTLEPVAVESNLNNAKVQSGGTF